jgi:hypothetical protein
MKSFLFLVLFFASIVNGIAQKKMQWTKNYWLSSNITLLFGDEQNGTGVQLDVGRQFNKGIKTGLGYSFYQFNQFNKVNEIHLYAEKSIGKDKKQLYFFASPGVAFGNNPKEQLQKMSSYEFKKSSPGINLQFGSGIRFMVSRHSFFIRAGYSITKYALYGTEYPTPIDPFNPFYEDAIEHQYKLQYNKLNISLGFTL